MNFARLRAALPPFSFSSTFATGDLAEEYCKFYGLDFAHLLPVRHCFGSIAADGYDVALHVFIPEDAHGTVFLLHGYYDHVGIYRHPISYFLRRGYVVVTYDQPGHGLSSGARASIDSFVRYQSILSACISLCEGSTPAPWHLVAQSMGGAIAMTHLLTHPETPFLKSVLFAPLVRPVGWRIGRWIHAAGKYLIKEQRRVFVTNSHDEEFLRFIREDDVLQHDTLPLQWVTALKKWLVRFEKLPSSQSEILVIQGTNDHTVDWRYNLPVISQKFPNSEIRYIPDGMHQLVNESERLRDDMFDEIDQFL